MGFSWGFRGFSWGFRGVSWVSVGFLPKKMLIPKGPITLWPRLVIRRHVDKGGSFSEDKNLYTVLIVARGPPSLGHFDGLKKGHESQKKNLSSTKSRIEQTSCLVR